MTFTYEIEGGNFSRAGTASSDIKKALKQLDLDYTIIKRVVVSLYEAEVNIVAHARRGTLTADIDPDRIVMVLDDQGPGIPDIDAAMTAGFSTASSRVREMGFGAGMGLPNIKKNADSLNIQSTVGVGTRLEIVVNF
ncbi:MAG: ATP-binding protein [Bacteroidales bacterium]|jgi:anti-sigma regulatory factor (Ser/Thr protein kinase)|nr:ATP-binding protein [Bacteroidales bacterium]NCU34780.1 anti-sigma regulatory factor [Candidatus Falkowbacteria bacterium]MDD2631302.1 ATP-binding protein [Bacteroidales bacterium]MDD3132698.1 ATP-binding protein [Bacteroidales bacterium]MDD3527682.1 ATP-binding protein [Bacteroidales bacterium]